MSIEKTLEMFNKTKEKIECLHAHINAIEETIVKESKTINEIEDLLQKLIKAEKDLDSLLDFKLVLFIRLERHRFEKLVEKEAKEMEEV